MSNNKKLIKEKVNNFSNVIFDFDGVIVDSENLKFQAYRNILNEKLNIVIDSNNKHWHGMKEAEVIDFWLRKFKIDCNEEEIFEIITHKREEYKRLINLGLLKLIPGIEEFLNYLKCQNKKIGLATSSNYEDVNYILNIYNLKNYFDDISTLDDVKFPKPNPEIYLKVASELNVSNSQCLVFEDTPTGVNAAQSAGMEVIVVLSSFDVSAFNKLEYFVNNFYDII